MRPFLIFCFLLLLSLPLLAQSNNQTAKPDDEFDIFLLTIAAIFACGMIAASIIGAMAAALVLFFLFSLIGLGVLSTSVAIGLYKRSVSAGFRSFTIILFELSSAVIGLVGLFLANAIFQFGLSNTTVALVGFFSGLAGGAMMGLATFKVLQTVFKYFVNKMKLTVS